MDADFWLAKWRKGETGFHQSSVHQALVRFWPSLKRVTGTRVLVPLCGKSLDMCWLRDVGFHVVGVELSPLAVDAFFEEHGLTPSMTHKGALRLYRAAGIELWCGDLFALRAADIGPVGAVYDRAALIALPADMRPRYVQQLRALTAPGCPGLLISVDYPQAQMNGPPFSVTPDEIERLYGADHLLRELECVDVLAASPNLAARGLRQCNERIWRVERR